MYIKIKVLKRVISVLCAAAMATSCTTGLVSANGGNKKKVSKVVSTKITSRQEKLKLDEEQRIKKLQDKILKEKEKYEKIKAEKEKKKNEIKAKLAEEKEKRLKKKMDKDKLEKARRAKLDKERSKNIEKIKLKNEKLKEERLKKKKKAEENIEKRKAEQTAKKSTVGEITKAKKINIANKKSGKKAKLKKVNKGIQARLKNKEQKEINPELNEILDLNNKETIEMSKKEKLDKETYMALQENILNRDGEAILNCGDEMLISSETIFEPDELIEEQLEKKKTLLETVSKTTKKLKQKMEEGKEKLDAKRKENKEIMAKIEEKRKEKEARDAKLVQLRKKQFDIVNKKCPGSKEDLERVNQEIREILEQQMKEKKERLEKLDKGMKERLQNKNKKQNLGNRVPQEGKTDKDELERNLSKRVEELNRQLFELTQEHSLENKAKIEILSKEMREILDKQNEINSEKYGKKFMASLEKCLGIFGDAILNVLDNKVKKDAFNSIRNVRKKEKLEKAKKDEVKKLDEEITEKLESLDEKQKKEFEKNRQKKLKIIEDANKKLDKIRNEKLEQERKNFEDLLAGDQHKDNIMKDDEGNSVEVMNTCAIHVVTTVSNIFNSLDGKESEIIQGFPKVIENYLKINGGDKKSLMVPLMEQLKDGTKIPRQGEKKLNQVGRSRDMEDVKKVAKGMNLGVHEVSISEGEILASNYKNRLADLKKQVKNLLVGYMKGKKFAPIGTVSGGHWQLLVQYDEKGKKVLRLDSTPDKAEWIDLDKIAANILVPKENKIEKVTKKGKKVVKKCYDVRGELAFFTKQNKFGASVFNKDIPDCELNNQSVKNLLGDLSKLGNK